MAISRFICVRLGYFLRLIIWCSSVVDQPFFYVWPWRKIRHRWTDKTDEQTVWRSLNSQTVALWRTNQVHGAETSFCVSRCNRDSLDSQWQFSQLDRDISAVATCINVISETRLGNVIVYTKFLTQDTQLVLAVDPRLLLKRRAIFNGCEVIISLK